MKPEVGLFQSSKLLNWATRQSLWFFSTKSGCCADEVMSAVGARYDLERFGCVQEPTPDTADLLLVSGLINQKTISYLKEAYDRMISPKFVIAIGACACSGGLFSPSRGGSGQEGIQNIIPVDIFVSGCPPRPEAIMNGILKLQEKLSAPRV